MKRALVTGGASPLGAAMCRELAGQGLHVIVHAHARTDAAERLAREIGEAGGSAGTLSCDLTNVTSTAAAVRELSLEVASRGITVNAVAPGIIESPAVAAALDGKRITELVPMKRAGTPMEVAALVGFLVSERAAYISGQTISINGGMA